MRLRLRWEERWLPLRPSVLVAALLLPSAEAAQVVEEPRLARPLSLRPHTSLCVPLTPP